MVKGIECIKIVNKDVLNEIAHAMNSLHSELLNEDAEIAKSIIDEVIEDSKIVINCYIDEQKTILIKLINNNRKGEHGWNQQEYQLLKK